MQRIIEWHQDKLSQLKVDNGVDLAQEFRDIVDSKEKSDIIEFIPSMDLHHSKNLVFKRLRHSPTEQQVRYLMENLVYDVDRQFVAQWKPKDLKRKRQ